MPCSCRNGICTTCAGRIIAMPGSKKVSTRLKRIISMTSIQYKIAALSAFQAAAWGCARGNPVAWGADTLIASGIVAFSSRHIHHSLPPSPLPKPFAPHHRRQSTGFLPSSPRTASCSPARRTPPGRAWRWSWACMTPSTSHSTASMKRR